MTTSKEESIDFDGVLESLFTSPEEPLKEVIKKEEHELLAEGVAPENPPKCLRCNEVLAYGEVTTKNGNLFTYMRCPKKVEGTMCFVTCGTEDSDRFCTYLEKVGTDLCHCYGATGNNEEEIPFENMECYCESSLILAMSASVNNPGRLYFKCRKNGCRFFQWADSPPEKKVWDWLSARIPPAHRVEQKYPPNELMRPSQFPRKHPFKSLCTPKRKLESPREHAQNLMRRTCDDGGEDGTRAWQNALMKFGSMMEKCVTDPEGYRADLKARAKQRRKAKGKPAGWKKNAIKGTIQGSTMQKDFIKDCA